MSSTFSRIVEATSEAVNAAATKTGSTRENYLGKYRTIRGWSYATQNGELIFEFSRDNVTWYEAEKVTTTANAGKVHEVKLVTKYARVSWKNTGGAGATLQLESAIVA